VVTETCQDEVYQMFLARPARDLFVCHIYVAPIPKTYLAAYRIVRHWILQGKQYTWLDIGNILMRNVTSVLVINVINSLI